MSWRGQAVAYGLPASMGSKRIGRRRDGRPVLVDDNDRMLRSWQQQLRESMEACAPPALLLGPVAVELTVYVLRPGAHYRTGKNAHLLKASAPALPATGRDLDKCARAAFDVGTGVWWKNDAQVCYASLARVYCERQPRTLIVCWEFGAEPLAAGEVPGVAQGTLL